MKEEKEGKPKEQKANAKKPISYNWRGKFKSREEMLRYLQAAER